MSKPLGLLILAPLLLACAPSAVDYSALRSAAAERQRAAGLSASPSDASVNQLVARPLTAESAAQIALLNNHGV
ncbi:MAG TPA: hypothetical protein VM686_29985, partial [Polyangiaceae bacterium]|nr:hypothetical protein [Polyangiaceae bacterium]